MCIRDSKRAVRSFGGYATQQLRRLENAIARDKLPQARREEHTLNSMKNAAKHFEEVYAKFDNGSIVLYTDESIREDLDREVFADVHLTKYPARDFNSIMNELTNIIGTYEKLNHRNHKKDDNHLNKHAMHLIRLYLMCLDLLENGDIVTYRKKDHDLLMSIQMCIRDRLYTRPCKMYNVGAMMPWMNYTPRTLDEILAACENKTC